MFTETGCYQVPITEDTKIHETLGKIKRKNDGRWEWWRWSSQFHKNWKGSAQGVTLTKEGAEAQILAGWYNR